MELSHFDLLWAVRGLPKPLRDVMKQEGSCVFVAGGYIRSCVTKEPLNDIDVFSATKEKAKELANRLSMVGKKPYETDNALTVKIGPVVVQFIHRWVFTTPTECIASFDFTIAKAAFWWSNEDRHWHSYCEDAFYADLAAKRLVYTSPVRNEDAGGSLLRVLKFYQRGYRIPLDSMGAVIARLMSAVRPGTHRLEPGVTAEQWTAKIITALLREVDPLVDPDAIGHIDSIQDDPTEFAEKTP